MSQRLHLRTSLLNDLLVEFGASVWSRLERRNVGADIDLPPDFPFQLMNGLDIPILANLLRQDNRGSPFIFEKVKRADVPSEEEKDLLISFDPTM